MTKAMFDRRSFIIALGCSAATAAWVEPASSRSLDRSLTEEAAPRDVARDPSRPEYHLLPRHNWMNDPNGPIWWKGKYHLFYQPNPHAAVWGDLHWGHAFRKCLVH